MSITSNEAKTMTSRTFRRVVTGHDPAGKAVVVADGPSEDVVIVSAIGLTIADMWPACRPASTHGRGETLIRRWISGRQAG